MNNLTPLKINLNTEANDIKLYVLSDVHLGSKECDLFLVKKVIKFIKDTPNCYCILLGDILDMALKNSKSDIYSSSMSGADTQKLAIELLTPIKDKILAITPGNHENRVWRECGIDISLWLAEKLNLENNYRANALAIQLTFGKDTNSQPYHLTIFGQHGAYGSGRKLGSAMNAIEDMDGIICNADLYIRAHTHSPIQGSRKVLSFNDKGNIETKIKYYFNAPAFLGIGGYGLDKGYRPQDNSPSYLNIRAYCEREGTKLCKQFKIDKISL